MHSLSCWKPLSCLLITRLPFWMAHLSCGEREELLQAARKLAPEFKEKFKGRRQEIEMKREQDMEKRIEENTHKELRAAQEKENVTNKFRNTVVCGQKEQK